MTGAIDRAMRPRRLIENAGTGVPARSVHVERRQADRFQRALVSLPVDDEDAPDPLNPSDGAVSEESRDGTENKRGHSEQAHVDKTLPAPQPPPATNWRELSVPVYAGAGPQPLPAGIGTMAAAGRGGTGEAPQQWESQLTQTISNLCDRTPSTFQTCSLVVPLDAAVLPETELRMTISPHRLQLRFVTQRSDVMHLMSGHCDRLAGLLEKTLSAPREIDIDIS